MEFEYGFTNRLLTSHAGLPALAQVSRSARSRAAFGPSLKTIPDADIFTTTTALLARGKRDFASRPGRDYRDDPSFARLLGLKRLPSAPASWDGKLAEASLRMIEAHAQPLAGKHGFVPLGVPPSAGLPAPAKRVHSFLQAGRGLGAERARFASGPGHDTAVLEERRPLADGRAARLISLVTRKTTDGGTGRAHEGEPSLPPQSRQRRENFPRCASARAPSCKPCCTMPPC